SNPPIGELYVTSNSVFQPCNADDQQVAGDLNSGMVALDIVHEDLEYCIHRSGTNGGSGRIPHPGEGYNTYFPVPADKALSDVQFLYWSGGAVPDCVTTDCVDTSPIGAFAYLEVAKTIDPYCQKYYGPSYHPLLRPWEYYIESGDQGSDVPQDAEVFDLNAGELINSDLQPTTKIYGCVSYTTLDTTPPTVSASATTADGRPYTAGTWTNQNVTVSFTCTDEQGGSGVDQVSGPVTVSDQTAGKTVDGSCSDNAGNTSHVSFGPIQIDKTKPVITASETTADGQPYQPGTWTRQDVAVAFRCADPNGVAPSGIATDTTSGATVSTEGADQSVTNGGECIDNAGNAADPVTVAHIKIDKTAPQIEISTPSSRAYPLNASVLADYACSDPLADGSTPGSGVASCAGPVDPGNAIDTASVGQKTFTVNASDNVGNSSSKSVDYQVTYQVCRLDPSGGVHHAGSTIPIRLDLCDANGNSVSSHAIVVTAAQVTAADGTSQPAQDAGNANPGNAFRYAGGRYIYNLDTKGLDTGDYTLDVTVAGDPVVHHIAFQLN
ncbi:MAG TPA: PxKF domain-containing protein, partial [Solirubrobacteraceae bacterium]|nr:PxKF domain-containing protein [Solirubrobacteraceae bacterium]